MINDLANIRQSIHLAHLENIDAVTIDVLDLVMLERCIKGKEEKISDLEIKLVAANIKTSNVIAEAINMKCAKRLDTFA